MALSDDVVVEVEPLDEESADLDDESDDGEVDELDDDESELAAGLDADELLRLSVL